MKKVVYPVAALFCLMSATVAFAGTQKGNIEVGAQFSLSQQSTDDTDDTDSTLVAATIGYFVTDALSLGGTLVGLASSTGNTDTALVSLGFDPKWHFNTQSSVVPYVGPELGFVKVESGGFSSTSFSYGVKGGVKSFVSENAALDTNLRYVIYSQDGAGGSSVDTTDLSLNVGINVYF